MKYLNRLLNISVFALCITLLSNVSHAQNYSKMYLYSLNSAPANLHSVDVITVNTGNTIVLARGDNNQLVLSKQDFSGSVIWDEAYDISNTTLSELTPYKIIEKQNGEILVVGFARVVNGGRNPFAAKFSSTGIFLQMMVYQSNQGARWQGYTNSGFERVNIVRVSGVFVESYIITAPGASPLNSTYQDVVVNAIRIDASTLNDVWNRKYFAQNITTRSAMTSGNALYLNYNIHAHKDHPSAIVRVPNGLQDKYIISGTTWQTLIQPNSFGFNNYYNFILSINNNGNIVDDYHGFIAPRIPTNQNMLWDPISNKVVMSYTIENTNVASTASPGLPSSIPGSVIAITKMDPVTLGYGLVTHDFFYILTCREHRTHGIIKNINRDGYVIGCTVYDDSTSPGTFLSSFVLLEVDSFCQQLMFVRYGLYTRIEASATTLKYDNQQTPNYVIAGDKLATSSSISEMRITSIDIGGSSCYQVPVDHGYGSGPLKNESRLNYPFVMHSFSGRLQDNISFVRATAIIDDCVSSPNPSSWKTTSIVDENMSNVVDVYPSLLRGNEHIKVSFTVNLESTVNVKIVGVDGRVYHNEKYYCKKGDNIIDVESHINSPGTYILKVLSDNVSLNKNVKLTMY